MSHLSATYEFIGVIRMAPVNGEPTLYNRSIFVMVDHLGPSTCVVTMPGRPADRAIFNLGDGVTFADVFSGMIQSVERQQRNAAVSPEYLARAEARNARNRAKRAQEGGVR